MTQGFRRIVVGCASVALVALGWWWLGSSPETTRQESPASALATESAPPAPGAADAESRPTRSPLSLRLLATTVSAEDARSRATIKDADIERRYVVRLGQALPDRDDVIVRSIELDRVVLDDRGKEVVLPLDPDITLASALELPTLETVLAEMGDLKDTERVVSGIAKLHLARVGARDLEALGTQAVFAPEPEEGGGPDHIRGLRVIRVTGGSFYDQIGLEPGDLLLAVNGHRLDRPEVTERAVRAFQHETALRLLVEGPDGPRELETRTVPVH
jgi:type II secretion system protein C